MIENLIRCVLSRMAIEDSCATWWGHILRRHGHRLKWTKLITGYARPRLSGWRKGEVVDPRTAKYLAGCVSEIGESVYDQLFKPAFDRVLISFLSFHCRFGRGRHVKEVEDSSGKSRLRKKFLKFRASSSSLEDLQFSEGCCVQLQCQHSPASMTPSSFEAFNPVLPLAAHLWCEEFKSLGGHGPPDSYR